MPPSFGRLVGAFGLIALAGTAFAADGRLYPSGPPNGVAYLRFVNLAPAEVTIVSPAAKITIPTDDTHRVGEFDPVTPGVALTGSVQLGEATKPINVTLQQNEFVTVAVTGTANALVVTLLRETPSDFNALKSSLGLFNLDQACATAQLVAGDQHIAVVSDVAPGAVGRRMVNPVDVGLAVSCGDPAQDVPAKLGGLVAGDRYSVFVVGSGSGRQVVATRDEQAPFRP
ncbi:MAG TPA: alginate O-acetyltransferase AlgF [Stellaceae bacterium]|nr:alginate O-acetyltransferase AlgF [Stellaceae bacterium]